MSSITVYNENLSKALLYVAEQKSTSSVLIELTTLGGDPNYKNSKGKSVIKIALNSRNIEYINWLNNTGIIHLDKTCALCFDEADNICSNCLTCYCSQDCQLIDWPFHKEKCKGLPITTNICSMLPIPEKQAIQREEIVIQGEDIVIQGEEDEKVVIKSKHFLKQSNIKAKPYSQNNTRQKPLFIKRYNTKCW